MPYTGELNRGSKWEQLSSQTNAGKWGNAPRGNSKVENCPWWKSYSIQITRTWSH